MALALDPLSVAIGATADEAEYVAELGALTLQGVRRKTPQLEALKEGARKQLKELASASSGSFVESADCVHRVRDELARVKRHLEALESHLPLSAVQADAQRRIDERRSNIALLAKHADVLEVLEQPMLMDTCVRNGFIDEALELEAAVRSRALVHANVPIAVRVAVEVSAHMGELRDALLTQLAGPLQLPDAMRVVGYLRRMGAHAMSEADLRAVFVRNRTIFFTQAEATLPRDSPATFLLKYIDLCRVHWYDTVTHYRAVFAADDEAAATMPAAPMPNPPCENAPPAGVSATQLGNLLLGKWAIERIDEFVLTLRTWLPRVREGAFLANLIEQCSYSARSLARVGMDVSAFARGPFRDAVLELLDDGLAAAKEHWLDAIRVHKWNVPHASAAAVAALAPSGSGTTGAPDADAAAAGGSGGSVGSGADRTATSPAPPLALLQHPPVAVLLNHFLVVFNEMRSCAPYELRPAFFNQVATTLRDCVRALADAREAAIALGLGAREHFRSLCACMAEHLVPYLAVCLDVLVPVWVPPPELQPAGGAPTDDGLAARLVEVVLEWLRPLHDERAAQVQGEAAQEHHDARQQEVASG